MTTNSQLPTTESKSKKKQKQKLRKQLEQEQNQRKWTSHGGFSVGRWRGRMGGEGTGNKKHNW